MFLIFCVIFCFLFGKEKLDGLFWQETKLQFFQYFSLFVSYVSYFLRHFLFFVRQRKIGRAVLAGDEAAVFSVFFVVCFLFFIFFDSFFVFCSAKKNWTCCSCRRRSCSSFSVFFVVCFL